MFEQLRNQIMARRNIVLPPSSSKVDPTRRPKPALIRYSRRAGAEPFGGVPGCGAIRGSSSTRPSRSSEKLVVMTDSPLPPSGILHLIMSSLSSLSMLE